MFDVATFPHDSSGHNSYVAVDDQFGVVQPEMLLGHRRARTRALAIASASRSRCGRPLQPARYFT